MSEPKYNVILVKSGANKVAMMQAVKEINPARFTALRVAKDFIDNPPGVVLANVTMRRAQNAIKILEKAGAVAEMQPSDIY